jgi:hypothetical protein
MGRLDVRTTEQARCYFALNRYSATQIRGGSMEGHSNLASLRLRNSDFNSSDPWYDTFDTGARLVWESC